MSWLKNTKLFEFVCFGESNNWMSDCPSDPLGPSQPVNARLSPSPSPCLPLGFGLELNSSDGSLNVHSEVALAANTAEIHILLQIKL